MSKSELLFWKIFNVCARVIGVMFVVIGGGVSVWGVSLLLQPNSTIALNGVSTNDFVLKIIVVVVPLLLVLLGTLLIRAPCYKPPTTR